MITQEILESKTGPELVDIFNGIDGVTPVKRFPSRENGIKRILLEEGVSELHTGTKTARVDTTKPNLSNAPSRTRTPHGEYNLDLGVSRSYRANSGRGRLLAELADGATFAELLEQFTQWNAGQLHKTILMLHSHLGFSLSTNDSGKITATR